MFYYNKYLLNVENSTSFKSVTACPKKKIQIQNKKITKNP